MNLPRRLALVITLFSVALMLAATFSLAQAAPDSAPDGGVVGTGTPASCTEAALMAALSGGGSITFNCGTNPYTITVSSGKTISVNTTLDGGNKITLSGGGTRQIFFVNPNIRLTLNNLTLANGYASMGGCVSVQGTLNATQTTFRNCASRTAFIFPGSGGAIYNWITGTIALTNSLLVSNSVDQNGGGIYLVGGHLTLNQVDIFTNATTMAGTNSGGGIYAGSGTQLTLTNSHLNYNQAYLRGGGVYLVGSHATFNQVEALHNTAWITHTGSGGGVYVDANSNFAASDSSFSYNGIGWQGKGGGLAVFSSTALLVNVTADYNRGLNAANGGGFYVLNSQFTLQGGSASGNYGLGVGGGLTLDTSVVNLNNVTIKNNRTGTGGGFYAFKGSLTINASHIDGNDASSDGGGFYLYNTPATIADSTINHNQGGRNGGGLENYMNTLTLDNVTVSGNVNTGEALVGNQGDGGGIYNGSGTIIAANSTIDHNTSTGTGGGLYNASDSSLILTNVTVSGNRAGTQGGAFYNQTNFSVADWTYITLTNVTVKDNVAGTGGGLWNGTDAHNLVYLKNTVLADNTASNCYGKAAASAKYSLSTDTSCTLSGTGNQTHTPAGLFPLLNNGGATKTHLPGPTSALVNSVVGVDCPVDDQRGIARPQGLGCDIGAVERQAVDATSAPWIYVPLLKR